MLRECVKLLPAQVTLPARHPSAIVTVGFIMDTGGSGVATPRESCIKVHGHHVPSNPGKVERSPSFCYQPSLEPHIKEACATSPDGMTMTWRVLLGKALARQSIDSDSGVLSLGETLQGRVSDGHTFCKAQHAASNLQKARGHAMHIAGDGAWQMLDSI